MDEAMSYDDIIQNQRREKKELIALTQKMKHNVSKADKKKKKEVNAEIVLLLENLSLKHEEELKIYHDKQSSNTEMLSLEASTLSLVEQDCMNQSNSSQVAGTEKTESSVVQEAQTRVLPKQSKAQKRRNRKAESAKEREKAIQEQEILNLSGNRHLEMAEITKKLSERNLVVHEVPPDGNCLYNAIEHQLSTNKLEGFSMKSLRKLTAEYLLSHKDEYIPFLTNPDTGDIFTDEQFLKYCNDIMNTSAWGGHVEIEVLARICGKPIEVIQSEGPTIIAGNEAENPKLIISYHRHAFGLGEHYNSVVPT